MDKLYELSINDLREIQGFTIWVEVKLEGGWYYS